jgi:hypothetical protein
MVAQIHRERRVPVPVYTEISHKRHISFSLYLLWLISRGVRGPLVDMDLHHAKVKFAELLGKIAGSTLE